MKLWANRNVNNEIIVQSDDAVKKFHTTKTKFKNDLLALVNEGLISVNEYPSNMVIELVDWEFDADDQTLC